MTAPVPLYVLDVLHNLNSTYANCPAHSEFELTLASRALAVAQASIDPTSAVFYILEKISKAKNGSTKYSCRPLSVTPGQLAEPMVGHPKAPAHLRAAAGFLNSLLRPSGSHPHVAIDHTVAPPGNGEIDKRVANMTLLNRMLGGYQYSFRPQFLLDTVRNDDGDVLGFTVVKHYDPSSTLDPERPREAADYLNLRISEDPGLLPLDETGASPALQLIGYAVATARSNTPGDVYGVRPWCYSGPSAVVFHRPDVDPTAFSVQCVTSCGVMPALWRPLVAVLDEHPDRVDVPTWIRRAVGQLNDVFDAIRDGKPTYDFLAVPARIVTYKQADDAHAAGDVVGLELLNDVVRHLQQDDPSEFWHVVGAVHNDQTNALEGFKVCTFNRETGAYVP